MPPGHGGIIVSLSPEWRQWFEPVPRWERWLPWFVFQVGRKRWRAVYPVTFLTVPAGSCQVQLWRPSDRLWAHVVVHATIDVQPGDWRQFAVGPGRRGCVDPPVLDERGVDVNTAVRWNRRMGMHVLLAILVSLVVVVAACLLGPHL